MKRQWNRIKLSTKRTPIFMGIILALVIATIGIGLIKNKLSGGSEIQLISTQKSFQLNEEPKFEFVYKNKRNIFDKITARVLKLSRKTNEYLNVGVKVFAANGEEVSNFNPQFEYQRNGKFSLGIDNSHFQQGLKPGKYKLELEIKDGDEVYIQDQDFVLGILAINTNKSIYLPGDKVYLQMAALSEYGHTLCDANLKLEIISPAGVTSNPEIQKSDTCGPDNVTDNPDYFAYYQTTELGVHQMKLKNLNNNYEIADSFEVRDSVPFDIERIGPMRIYPPAEYQITLRIKANQDFIGKVIETVPDNFEVKSQNSNLETTTQNSKLIIWDVDWKAGETYELKYQFDAPDLSPYLYLLGPLEIGSFKEIRQWQIAADQFSGITARGKATESSSDNSISVSPSANLTVGKLIIVNCVTDNDSVAVSDGPSSRHSTVADSKSNSWGKLAEYTDSDGAAADGVTISTWASKITTQITTSDSITLTVAANVTEKIISVFEVTLGLGGSYAVEQIGVGQSAISASVSSMPSREYLLVGHGGAEGTDSTKTPDSDYTERFDLRTGSYGSKVTQHVVTRIATLTDDTCTSSAWTNTNPVFLLFAIYEFIPPITVSGKILQESASSPYEETTKWSGCNGSTTNISWALDGTDKPNISCADADGYFSFTPTFTSANQLITIWIDDGSNKGVLYTKNNDTTSDISGLTVYKDRVWIQSESSQSITNSNISTFDKTQDGDIPIDSDGTNVAVDNGVELHINTSDTYAPGGNVSVDKLHIKGTYSGNTETLTLSGSGTAATCDATVATIRPLCLDSGGAFNTNTNHTTKFTGTSDSNIEATSYKNLSFLPEEHQLFPRPPSKVFPQSPFQADGC